MSREVRLTYLLDEMICFFSMVLVVMGLFYYKTSSDFRVLVARKTVQFYFLTLHLPW